MLQQRGSLKAGPAGLEMMLQNKLQPLRAWQVKAQTLWAQLLQEQT